MKKKKYVIIFAIIFIYTFFVISQERVPVEELDIINGLGYDTQKTNKGIVDYLINYSAYVYKPNLEKSNVMYKGNGLSVGEVHQNKQRKINKKVVQGQERIILIGDEYARFGIGALIDERFRNPEFNDMAYMLITKGNTNKYLDYKEKEYINASEFIYGLIDNAINFNFFSQNYKVVDCYVRLDAEGRNIVLPLLEIGEQGIKISGSALFKKEKMVSSIDIKETKILNLLKYENVKGILSIEKDYLHYTDFYAEQKERKIECYKKDGNYQININLNIVGKIVSNELYDDISKDINVKKIFEEDLAKKIEEECSKFISKMQHQYKVDCLDLGREVAAKYGRKTGVDWNEVISRSDIKVKPKVSINGYGRGDY